MPKTIYPDRNMRKLSLILHEVHYISFEWALGGNQAHSDIAIPAKSIVTSTDNLFAWFNMITLCHLSEHIDLAESARIL